MVHPTELLRTDSTGDGGSFVAPVGDYKNDVDCGCSALPCLGQRLNLEKYAKPRYFVTVLALTASFSGIIVKYFRGTSQVWSQHYNITPDTIDWLIYINEVFVGILAIFVAYLGNKMHRPKWLGGLTIYLGVSCFIVAIPEIYQPFRTGETDINVVNGRVLCQIPMSMDLKDLNVDINNQIVAFTILIMFQVVYALFTISFVSHGVTYIDDNTSPSHSPAFFAIVFAAQRMGKQSGIFAAWIPHMTSSESIFISILWLMVAALLILVGSLVAMFPKIMPNILLRKSVNSLLSIASGNAITDTCNKSEDGFFVSLWRVLKNRVLLLNIAAMMSMQAAVINFNIKEKNFNQSKYHVSKYNDASGYSDPTLIQFSTNILRQPLIAVSYIIVGLVIAKVRPRPKLLVLWNIKVFVTVFVTFALTRFFKCAGKLNNEINGRLTHPYCSWNCGCSLDGSFQPICLNGQTHFSPCWAGCTSFDSSLKIYGNCTCGTDGRTIAADGSCDADNCSTYWAFAQAHAVISSALLGTTFITTIFITLRSVATKDKALALGLYLSLISLVAYLPVRAIYDAGAGNFCQIWGKSKCQFYSEYFALFVAIITLCFKALAILVSVALVFFVKDLELYKNNSARDSDLSFLRRPENYRAERSDNSNNNNVDNREDIVPGSSSRNLESSALIHDNKQRSESLGDRSNKGDRINMYLSDGDLVPSLEPRLAKTTSKNSNNSGLSTDSSLAAIANAVGDDHDSDFSTIQRPTRVNQLEKKAQRTLSNTNTSPSSNNIQETEF
ncbi:hypothetical protein ABEB36_011508 [Hypothenemus hampei]|uniref:Uncharacterized protein n=1 Tax=Hypothenemus hampei TaxID=57062 RepID=A0ABD1EFQ2_HYPHA